MTVKHIAVVPGDGIGNEVIAAGMVVLDAVSQISSFQMDAEYVDIGSERYLKTGELLTDEDVALLKGKDAIYFGAIGDPRVAPGILEQGILLRMRAVFDQYINLRPATSWFPLVPLKREVPFDIHFLRENTEDFYMGANGTFGPNMGGDSAHVHVRRELYDLDIDINAKSSNNDDFAFEIGLLSKTAVTRFADYCCRYALNRGDRKVTLVDKANVITRNYGMQREIFKEKTAEYGLDLEFMFVDAMAMAMIVRPETFGTVAVPNLFGDPEGVSMFEPIHGSAPDIAGRGIANPIAAILAAQMLLENQGYPEEGKMLHDAVRHSLDTGRTTPDLGGTLKTPEVAKVIADYVLNQRC